METVGGQGGGVRYLEGFSSVITVGASANQECQVIGIRSGERVTHKVLT